jgi:hypothetical protein
MQNKFSRRFLEDIKCGGREGKIVNLSLPGYEQKKGGKTMLFVALMRLREGKMQSAIEQRMQWEFPEGVKRVGEYWLTTNDPKVVSIYEADSYEPILQMNAAWDDALILRHFLQLLKSREWSGLRKQ